MGWRMRGRARRSTVATLHHTIWRTRARKSFSMSANAETFMRSPVLSEGGSAEQGSFSAMLLAQLVLLHPLRRGLGERRAELPQPRHLELRQPFRRKRPQLLCRHRLLRHHERLYLLPEHRIGHADHRHLRDARMLAQGLLDQHRRHVLASAPDDVALAVDEVEPAVLVEEAEVAGEEPAVAEGGRG